MNQALRDRQSEHGAKFDSRDEQSIVSSFGNDQEAIAAVSTGVALCDRTHWGRLQLSDRDRLAFLHNQSSNAIQSLQPGQGCDTVILTSTARTIDLVSVYVMDDSVMLLVSPNRRQQLMQWFDRYIFFGDRVQITDLTESTAAFTLLGPQSLTLLTQLGVLDLLQDVGCHQLKRIKDIDVRVAMGSGLVTPGYTLFSSAEEAARLWQYLVEANAVPMGENAWEQLRVQQGRPSPDAELTEDYNPLEAGLWHTLSFDKGCYIGQETIARLNTYQGVKQQLWGIRLTAAVPPGIPITVNDQKVGTLTSVVETDLGPLGLAYVKTKAGGAGLSVTVGKATGTLLDVPFLTRAIQPPPASE